MFHPRVDQKRPCGRHFAFFYWEGAVRLVPEAEVNLIILNVCYWEAKLQVQPGYFGLVPQVVIQFSLESTRRSTFILVQFVEQATTNHESHQHQDGSSND